MTLLALLRHGETDWNREGRVQGATDVPLNDTGRAQAREAAALVRSAFDPGAPVVVAASDLGRARETAQIIAGELGTRVSGLYADLRERAYGSAEGLPAAEFTARFGEFHRAQIPDAEPWEVVRRRAVRGLRHAVRDARRATAPRAPAVVVVSHGGLIRELLRHATGGDLPVPGTRIANGTGYLLLLERERLSVVSSLGVRAAA